MSHINEKLKEIFENTVESGLKYDGPPEDPEYFSLSCQAIKNETSFRLMGNTIFMFNCDYKGKEAVMIVFSIPINTSEESGAKSVAERVMQIVEETEKCFVTLDSIKSEEVKEDKFVYVTAIKTLNGGK